MKGDGLCGARQLPIDVQLDDRGALVSSANRGRAIRAAGLDHKFGPRAAPRAAVLLASERTERGRGARRRYALAAAVAAAEAAAGASEAGGRGPPPSARVA